MKIITVTLNASLDRTLVVHYLAVGYHNVTTETTMLDPAGRGVNLARALQNLQFETHAVVMVGSDATSRAYQALLMAEKFPSTTVRFEGVLRSNIVLLDTGNETETIILEESHHVSEDTLEGVYDALETLVEPGDVVVFAGSLPGGLPDDTYVGMIEQVRQRGGAVAVDTDTSATRAMLPTKPETLLLEQQQIEALFSCPVRAPEDIVYYARQLCTDGVGQVVFSLNDFKGAMLINTEKAFMVAYPEDLDRGTRGGMTDALLAGILVGQARGLSMPKALELGGAAAAYALSRVGNEFPTWPEVRQQALEIAAQRFEE